MIPDFQTLMLPLLQMLADGKEHKLRDLINALSDKFGLSDEERSQLLPSGNQVIIDNRIGWARTYLKKSGLLSAPQRATFIITEDGKRVLSLSPARIDIAYLKKLPSFQEWVNSYSNFEDSKEEEWNEMQETVLTNTPTPAEYIDMGHRELVDTVSFDVLERIKSITPKQFEHLVLKLLSAMGYGGFREDAVEHTGKSSDGGIDGLIRQDKLGLETIYVQAKQYTDAVQISQIRDFAGALLSKKAKKGVFITASTFPKSAYDYTNNIEHKIVLINGKDLALLMIEYNIGVSTKRVVEIKDIDNDFFDEL